MIDIYTKNLAANIAQRQCTFANEPRGQTCNENTPQCRACWVAKAIREMT